MQRLPFIFPSNRKDQKIMFTLKKSSNTKIVKNA